MAKEDFCFTYYDGDAARDKAHMTRLQRGAYDDIISAQRKRGHLSLEDIQRVLSKDFEECWPALEWVLKKDAGENFFIEWVDKSIEKMRKHAQNQKERIEKYWANKKNNPTGNTGSIPRNNHGIKTEEPLEDGNGNGNINGFKEGGMGETIPQGIVPDMLQDFVQRNLEYPVNQETDFSALREIGGKIVDWLKLPGDFTHPKNLRDVRLRWGELIIHVKAHSHFQTYSISQINKHFQSICQSYNTGKNAKQGASQVGRTFEPD